ncbi:2-oxoglutarate-Fe(II) type oxidoreductase hxnY-like isoform X2 [Raphanus sativus]|uniref:2-oxoglutarate-Fe(II) type oxidoreductase hxnY-like isoform X2 n=2 Tax=Raphanus TaxID=3725 RepID=A0A9W3D5H2_RAPSA|nr:2-oxoglutarate-Fe(II) type oxidoreductase hxnY-like isoform X2 [Raphanus sativus]WLO59272.1 2-oxoglutarate-Fe(II) type oxidoreductase-like protein [Raphanus raphanistrum]
MSTVLQLSIIDLSLPEKLSTSRLIRRAYLNHGFFYLTNHGVPEELMKRVFEESKNLFSLPLDEKIVMVRRGFRGYSPLYDEKGDPKELFTFGSSEGVLGQHYPNKWPSEDLLPLWRPTMERYYKSVVDVGKKLLGLVALALDLEENFFERLGAFNDQAAVVRLLRYSGELSSSEDEEEKTCGASAHSDFGILTLLATDGVPGLQVCRDKDKEPNVWEDVPGIKGAFVVNIGDLMERWTNGLFRSTMHRVLSVGKERYSVAVFLDPDPNCVVECLESCCSETSPPRFPPVRTSDYFHERFSQSLISYSGSA